MRKIIAAMLVLPLAGCGVEVLTATAIQGELAAQNAKQATTQLNNAKDMKADIEISQAIRVYQAEKGAYPPSLEALVPDFLAAVPAGYTYNPATGEFSQGNGGGSGSLGNAIPPSDINTMMDIRKAINAYGTATGFYPNTLDALVPDYLPQVPLASNGEPYVYSNLDGDLIHPSRLGQPTTNYAEGGGMGGYDSSLDGNSASTSSDSDSYSKGVQTRRERSAAQYGGMSPGGLGSPVGSTPNPKAVMDRTKSNLNQAVSGRGGQ